VESIRRLVAALGESARTVEHRTGLTNAQLFLLRCLQREHELTINELAAHALTQQSTVSLLVSRLEKSGYVRRARSPHDARHVHVSLTNRGRELTRRAPRPPLRRMIDALERLPESDAEGLIRGLNALLKEMRVPAGSSPLFERSAKGG
jgi:DNA-binding MarR family transcriptional regulator